MSTANARLKKKALEELKSELQKDHLWQPTRRYSKIPAKVRSRPPSPAPVAPVPAAAAPAKSELKLEKSQNDDNEPSTIQTPRPSTQKNSDKTFIPAYTKPDFIKLNIESINRTPLRRSASANALNNETEPGANVKKQGHVIGQVPA